MIIDMCPHCATRHVQTALRFHEVAKTGDGSRLWDILRCQNAACEKLILAQTSNSGQIQFIYPTAGLELDAIVPVSQEIRDDFREAGMCLGSGCYKASLVMSRRVLQRCLKEHGATQHSLVDAIAHAVKDGILRKSFHEVAEEIRQYGNLSAHPDDDQLQSANRDSAESVLEFTRLLIHEFYEVPAAAGRLKKSRTT